MEITIGAEIRVKDAPEGLQEWCRTNLIIPNPEYADRKRRGMWTGNTPQYLWLYWVDGQDLMLPSGVGRQLRGFMGKGDRVSVQLADNGLLDYGMEIPLYEYQKPAVEAMRRQSCGILQSPCGSGKTQMGIALAASISRKALWVTHTQDLLSQSYGRAAQYLPREVLGTITAGKVQAGSHMTFATVQTLARLDLNRYRNCWDTVIVDECHRLAGTPSKAMMFYRVLGSLAARHKYGLSATVHRSDGMIRSTFAVLGPVVYRVPDEAVAEKTMKVRIVRRETQVTVNRVMLDTDGTLDYGMLIRCLVENTGRCSVIAGDLCRNREHYNLILSDRLEHLRRLMGMLPQECREAAVMIDGSMAGKRAKADRERAIEDMREGKKHFLFATFSLAKEGLDIPRLDRLYMATPKKDYAVVTQSIGRIARTFPGKEDAVCYDYVDSIPFCENQWKKRRTHYRKAGCAL